MKKKHFQKLFLMLSALVCLIFHASACQPTPEESIVIQKDPAAMLNQAESSPSAEGTGAAGQNGATPESTISEQVSLPADERYAFEADELDGRLKIRADAAILCPDAAQMPILHVQRGSFSQQEVYRVFRFFFTDTLPYDQLSGRQSREDIEKIILRYRQQLADGSYTQQGLSKDDCHALLASWEEAYAATPEGAAEYMFSDGTLSQETLGNSGTFYRLDVSTSKNRSLDYGSVEIRDLIITTPDSESQKAVDSDNCFLLYERIDPIAGTAERYTTENALRIDPEDIPAAVEECPFPFSEARVPCEELLQKLEPAKFSLGAAFLVDDGKTKDGDSGHYAYKLFYARSVTGIPLFTNTQRVLRDSEFSSKWSHEYICFIVDDSGIIYFYWGNPAAPGETAVERAALKPFDEITEIFETMIRREYTAFVDHWYGTEGQMDISIDRVTLCLMRIRVPDAADAGLLVPAWVFEGTNRAVSASGEVSYNIKNGTASSLPSEPFPVMVINAVDGSIIDLSRGY